MDAPPLAATAGTARHGWRVLAISNSLGWVIALAGIGGAACSWLCVPGA